MRALLKFPLLYSLFKRILGGREPISASILKEIISKMAQDLKRPPLVLDLGCGEGGLSKFLGECCEYVGLDISDKYISFACKNYGKFGKFYVYDIGLGEIPSEFLKNREPDFIFLIGVIHHLTDAEFSLIKKGLLDKYVKAAFLSIDGVFLENQNLISNILLRLDRGNHVRWTGGYQKLFENYNFIICHYTKFPYDYIFFYRHLPIPSLVSENFEMLEIQSVNERNE